MSRYYLQSKIKLNTKEVDEHARENFIENFNDVSLTKLSQWNKKDHFKSVCTMTKSDEYLIKQIVSKLH